MHVIVVGHYKVLSNKIPKLNIAQNEGLFFVEKNIQYSFHHALSQNNNTKHKTS